MDVNTLIVTDTGKPTEVPPPPEPTTPAGPKTTICEGCKRELNDDTFCELFGPVREKWLCDECVTANRGQGLHMDVSYALYKKFMDERAIRTQLDIVKGCLENLAEIKGVEGHDAAGSYRSVDVNLTFRESRPVYRELYEELR